MFSNISKWINYMAYFQTVGLIFDPKSRVSFEGAG